MSEKKSAKIIVWSADWCGYCHALMDWLNDSGLPYEERDGDGESWITGFPTAEIVDDSGKRLALIEGFQRDKILKAIEKYDIKSEGNDKKAD
ncbi:hypothetical protein FWC63_01730 [Candidatus Saccharibacteria bacterium]|nr:hypothetical protein [Candidatus Saccharibacteria bacterium]